MDASLNYVHKTSLSRANNHLEEKNKNKRKEGNEKEEKNVVFLTLFVFYISNNNLYILCRNAFLLTSEI